MNMKLDKTYTIKKRNGKKTHLNHAFAEKIGWKRVRDEMNRTSDIQYNSVMTTRQEFITAMEKLSEYMIINFLQLDTYTQEDVRKLAVSEDFNEMVYEVLYDKYKK